MAVAASAAVFAASADVIVDFPRAAGMRWSVWAGRFADGGDPQLAFTPSGMRLRLDPERAKDHRRMAAPGPAVKPLIPGPARLRLCVRVPGSCGVDATRLSLGLVDSQGERFDFCPADAIRSDDGLTLVYDVFDNGWRDGFRGTRPRVGGTRGTNRNERLDFPVRIDVFCVRLKEGASSGDITFVRLDDEDCLGRRVRAQRPLFADPVNGDLSDWKAIGTIGVREGRLAVTGGCAVAAIEHIRWLPGLKPTLGMAEVRVRTSRAYSGGAVSIRAVDLATRRSQTFKAPWREETVIRTGLARGVPYQVVSLAFHPPAHARTNLDFTVSSVVGVWDVTPAQAVMADVDTGDALHLIAYGSGSEPRLVLRNTALEPVSFSGTARIRDFWGRGRDVPLRADLDAGEARAFALGAGLEKGIWRVLCDWTASDGSSAWAAPRLAVIDFAKPTPRWPQGWRFRVGVCYHPAFYSRSAVDIAISALVRAGVKLARINCFAFRRCEPEEGLFDWAKADELQSIHERNGISINAGLYGTPEWAASGDGAASRRNADIPPRPGLLRDYARALAARYGTKIDYYELGNEWDMVPEAVLPEEEAFRLHREAHDGLKEGCKAAKLISNGWASDMDYSSRHVRAGFQRRYMQRVRDICDFHAFHLHGAFAGYAKSVETQLARRAEDGIGMPWYSNETALSSVNGGEEEAARTVWKKVLYAWASGSVDYIWYNLNAAGWVPCDEEQGYGLMTADRRPRAGYPALAGLIGSLQGLEFAETLKKGGDDFIFSFSGERDGFRGIALAGWRKADASPPLVVRTDAKVAFAVDLFGNRRALAAGGDEVRWPLGEEPGALLLPDAALADLME